MIDNWFFTFEYLAFKESLLTTSISVIVDESPDECDNTSDLQSGESNRSISDIFIVCTAEVTNGISMQIFEEAPELDTDPRVWDTELSETKPRGALVKTS